jgi:hypothetical protein
MQIWKNNKENDDMIFAMEVEINRKETETKERSEKLKKIEEDQSQKRHTKDNKKREENPKK